MSHAIKSAIAWTIGLHVDGIIGPKAAALIDDEL